MKVKKKTRRKEGVLSLKKPAALSIPVIGKKRRGHEEGEDL